ncbi:MAG TPA: hypothetical protein VJC07_03915 [Candidatus Nanoarchaeia archaeon]|nr:hypothetical protein [Candidatus Nanoarchaeia archaeon]
MEFLARGKRGIVYLDEVGGRKVVVKKARESSTALNRIENEANWLRKLNKEGIGPKLIEEGEGYFIAEFVDGTPFGKWIEKNMDKKILIGILKQCRTMDKMKVNKYEMHNPVKNIIVNDKPVLIDFERCKFTHEPKNVTQFVQFLVKRKILERNDELNAALKKYKEGYSETDFKKLISLL